MLTTIFMLIFSKFFSFIFFGLIWSRKLNFPKLTKIWCKGTTLLYVYYDFNAYFFKSFVIHIILGKFGPKGWCCPITGIYHLCTYWYYMLIVSESSNFFEIFISFHLVFSKLTESHCDMLITNLIFSFSIFSYSNFLLVCNYINNIYLFQKLNIFLCFKEAQIWLTQLLYCEANFASAYVTVQKLWYIQYVYNLEKTTLSSVEVLSNLVFWHES